MFSVIFLQVLDLSHTGLMVFPEEILKALVNLKSINLAYNEFKLWPSNLQFVGKSLETLNLAGNQIERLSEANLVGLKSLKALNISDNLSLKYIENGTFTKSETLENLHCSHNPKLQTFDLDGLTHCNNLTQVS